MQKISIEIEGQVSEVHQAPRIYVQENDHGSLIVVLHHEDSSETELGWAKTVWVRYRLMDA